MREYKLKKCKRVHGIHFTPEGTRVLAVGGAEVRMVDTAVWLDLATGENIGRIDQFAECYAVDPQLTRLVLGGANQWRGLAAVQWTALPDGDGWHTFPKPEGKKSALPGFKNVSGMAFDPSGELLAIAHGHPGRGVARNILDQWEFKVTVVRVEPGEVVAKINIEDSAGVVNFNSTATRFAVTGGIDGDTTVSVYDVSTGNPVSQTRPPATVTRCMLFTSDDRLIVANGRNVYVVPQDRERETLELTGHPKQVNAVALTRDDQRLLTASHDGMIRVWDVATGRHLTSFDWEIGPVTAVAFSPDGLTCAAAGLNGKVVVWDVEE